MEDTVEPSSEPEPGPTTRPNPPVEVVVDLTDSDKYSKAAVRWSPTPKPIDQPENPCEKKKLELKKAYAHLKSVHTEQSVAPVPVVSAGQDLSTLIQISPREIGKLAGTRYGWDQQNTVTSRQYVQGVVAAHDHVTRIMIDGLRKLFEEKPLNPEDALHKWQSVSEWLTIQDRPPTPKQCFDD